MKVILGSAVATGIRDAFNAAADAGDFNLLGASLATFPSSESFAEVILDEQTLHADEIKGQNVTIVQSMREPIDISAMQLIFAIKNIKELPKNAKDYIYAVEDFIESKISSISTSPEREDTILIENPFEI